MRVLAAVLAFLIVILQYPLWLGRGGWLRVWDLDRQVSAQKAQNDKLVRRNGALEAEVRDLKQGFEAVEERARWELGMIRQDEIFFQIIPAGAAKGAGTPNSNGVNGAGGNEASKVASPATPAGSVPSSAAGKK